jgi:uncharacterized membrane protein
MMAAGAAIRQFFVLRHGYKLGRNAHPWPYALVGVVAIVGVVVWLAPTSVDQSATKIVAKELDLTRAGGQISYKSLQTILAQRCTQCHGEHVQMKNVRLDSPEDVKRHAQGIYQQAVVTRAMPLNNATGISDAERGLIRHWFESGAYRNPP